jgi:glycosyltransferase involved in cell wall biosynthesis
MKGKPLVSVIVPFYNEEEHLHACLSSIQLQRFKNFELLPVDDGSTDGSSKIAARFARVIKGAHLGPGAARNRAARRAKGGILVFIDADMTAAPDFLGKIISPIKSGEEDGTFVLDELVLNPENRWSRAWSLAHGLPPERRIAKNFPLRGNAYRAVAKIPFFKAGGFREERGVSEDELDTSILKPALGVRGAVLYHANPASMAETWLQARWFGRGKASYESPALWLARLARHSLPRSLAAACWGAVRQGSPFFAAFKLLFDPGVFYGLLEGRLTGRKAR